MEVKSSEDCMFVATLLNNLKNIRCKRRCAALDLRFPLDRHRIANVLVRSTAGLLIVLAGMIAGEPCASAQLSVPMSNQSPGAPIAQRSGATLKVSIVDDNKKPLKQQAMLRLTGKDTGRILFQTTRGSETTFTDLPVDKYLLEVGAAGYLGRHEEFTIANVAYDLNETVILSLDPAAVELKLKDAGQLPREGP